MVNIRLAGGKYVLGGLTTRGEVMVGPDLTNPRDSYSQRKPEPNVSKWILPDCRLTDELDIVILKGKGKVTLKGGPLKRAISCTMVNRLPYLTWDDFNDIRELLTRSHMNDRKGLPSTSTELSN